jgi:hypothetical protein
MVMTLESIAGMVKIRILWVNLPYGNNTLYPSPDEKLQAPLQLSDVLQLAFIPLPSSPDHRM